MLFVATKKSLVFNCTSLTVAADDILPLYSWWQIHIQRMSHDIFQTMQFAIRRIRCLQRTNRTIDDSKDEQCRRSFDLIFCFCWCTLGVGRTAVRCFKTIYFRVVCLCFSVDFVATHFFYDFVFRVSVTDADSFRNAIIVFYVLNVFCVALFLFLIMHFVRRLRCISPVSIELSAEQGKCTRNTWQQTLLFDVETE